jgi:hypothetical protein
MAVQASFDYLTVPGTVAAFYPDATAAFVLTSGVEYLIDPRTPLFQGQIDAPRAPHYELAAWHGDRVRQRMGDKKQRAPVSFNAAFYSTDTINEMVDAVIGAQHGYGQRAPGIQEQLDRYRQLRAEAQGREIEASASEQRPPAFVIAPYFVTNGVDAWAAVNDQVVARCRALPEKGLISAMVAVDSVARLEGRLTGVPGDLAPTTFYWVQGFNERTVAQSVLTEMWTVVRKLSGRPLVNFYGGFFSICMGRVGLWGFNNGLGYSEARDWPELSSTGAAPARYYLRPLHMYVPPALGQLIIEGHGDWACACQVCSGKRVVALTYHELKQHFALSRRWEIDLVDRTPPPELATQLKDAAKVYEETILPQLPPGTQRLDVSYLRRWAAVLENG